MARMFTLLKKDWYFLLLIPGVTILIPAIFLLIFSRISTQAVEVGVYGDLQLNESYEIISLDHLDQGLEMIENNEIDLVYDAYEQVIYGSEKNATTANRLYEVLNNIEASSKEEDLTVMVLSIFIVISSLTATVTISSIQDREVIKSILLTPVTYTEYIFSKILLVLVGFWLTIALGACLLSLFNIAIWSYLNMVLVYGTVSLIALTLISMAIKLGLSNSDLSDTLHSLFIQGCLLFVIYAYQTGFETGLPITSGFKSIIGNNEFPLVLFLILTGFSFVMTLVSSQLFRRQMRA